VYVRFRSEGDVLVGRLARPSGMLGAKPGLVLCHGFPSLADGAVTAAANVDQLADRVAASLGWVALSVSFRGCGESEGDFSLRSWLADVSASVTRLEGERDVAGVWIAGFGTGGALAVCCAASEPRVRGVITLSSPAGFEDWARYPRRLLEFARETGVIRRPHFPADFEAWAAELRSVRPLDCAEQLPPRSLMVVHGSDDVSVPTMDARLLADAHGTAEVRFVPGADHHLMIDPRAIAILGGWLDRQWAEHQRGR
jgi:uncharacterized protein